MAAHLPTTEKGRATRLRILEAAARLISERGAGAVSLEDIEREAEVGRSQLYHYFYDRDDLVRTVIDVTTDAVLGAQDGLLDDLDSFAAIDRWFDALVALQDERGAIGGCPIGSLVGQLAERDEPTRTALAAGFARWEQPLIDGLARMRDRGELKPEVSVQVLADVTMAAIQGGLLLTQVRRDPQQLRHSLDGARTVLAAAAVV
ncbi:TetR/AcrR family transcriptional regulator [Solirubrobacter ginsenosidimutans]|uniref:TetR/AcrR family transcriptional regulator n=1 Tax=Solirubrobacter ginsenosidimutans TaxID=490573 RepID=A0A9X3MMN9_9ACTN|nr:TetR/AcrR family transcriptional regulator [Solirubrobacter ginsenosidimutans]MDA0158997.1 TetR/AcrR family transcriptional regulator [Solirubrobacter ginsenosidimutans]